jgi:multiple sugar transport system permease protein
VTDEPVTRAALLSAPIARRRSVSQHVVGYGLLFPAVAAIALLLIFPVAYSAWLSLTNTTLLSSTGHFVGLANYTELIGSSEFRSALLNGIIYTLATTALSVGLGVAFALLMNRNFIGRRWLSAIVILPYLIPSVATVLIFNWQLDPNYGMFNQILLDLHLINTPVAWLGSPSLAMFTVIMVSAWAFFPIVYIMVLARLQTIRPSLYAAARVDGANVFQRFRYITLPQLRNVLFLAVLLRGIWIFNTFDMIWLLTGGGPQGSTENLPVLVYKNVFIEQSLSKGAATAMMMFLLLALFSALYFVIFRRRGRSA